MDGSQGPTAGYENNVDQKFGETGEKKGIMSKIKEKLLPDGPDKMGSSVSASS